MAKLNRNISGILFLSFAFIFIACSDDDSNPTASERVNYAGSNSMGKDVYFSIVGDKVTAFSIDFEITDALGTFSGTKAQTNSKGFATVVDNSFSINLETNEVINGTISGNFITGSFNLLTGRTINNKPETVSGTFTVEKL